MNIKWPADKVERRRAATWAPMHLWAETTIETDEWLLFPWEVEARAENDRAAHASGQ